VPGTKAGEVEVALAPNRIPGRRGYFSRWVTVAPAAACGAPFVEGLADAFPLPIAHAEGRFVAPDPVLDRLEAEGQVALRYAGDADINGSRRRIAGICDPTGLVFGLMPHPERYVAATQHPAWTSLPTEQRDVEAPGLRFFRHAVQRVSNPSAASVA
jgi:phosphoribosylformylglycinamidine synthase